MIRILGGLLAIFCFHLQASAYAHVGDELEMKELPAEILDETKVVKFPSKPLSTADGMSLENAYPFYNETFNYQTRTIDSEPDILSIEHSIELGGSVIAMIILLSGIRFSVKR